MNRPGFANTRPDLARSTVPREGPERGAGPVLLLQGPVGGFFGQLARGLAQAGLPVYSVHFNLGDWLFGLRSGESLFFKGDLAGFEAWLTDYCITARPRCILVFGDRRPVHAVACRVAAVHGVRVFSFEEGYIRPDYITFEEGGNNARSPFAGPEEVLPPEEAGAHEIALAQVPFTHMPPSFGAMAWRATLYFILNMLGQALVPAYRHHRQRSVFLDTVLWTRSLARKIWHTRPEQRVLASLIQTQDKAYFVVALQVHDDLQLLHHGDGWTAEQLIEQSIRAFARAAPPASRLVVRYHPMDRGHRSYGPLVQRIARECRVEDRVILMYTGHGPTLLDHAAGCITINSTITLSALFHHCPVAAMGDAFFKRPGLAVAADAQGGLDRFFQNPPPVDEALHQQFRVALIHETQINGSYYLPDSYPGLIAAVVARLRREGIVEAQAGCTHRAELP